MAAGSLVSVKRGRAGVVSGGQVCSRDRCRLRAEALSCVRTLTRVLRRGEPCRDACVIHREGMGSGSAQPGAGTDIHGRRRESMAHGSGRAALIESPRLLCFSVRYRAGPASEAGGRWRQPRRRCQRREDLGCRVVTTRRLLSSTYSGASQPGGVSSWSRGEAASEEVCQYRGGGQ